MDSEAVEQAVERFLAGGDPGDVVGISPVMEFRSCDCPGGVAVSASPLVCADMSLLGLNREETWFLDEGTLNEFAIPHTPRVARFVAAVDALGGGAVRRDTAQRLWAESEGING